MVIGEIANFAAYAFAPAILVTPLGALSVLIGAVLGSYFLKEELGTLGKLGCAICLIGSVIIVLHAPPDTEITTVDEILHYAIQPGTSIIVLISSLLICLRFPVILFLCLYLRWCYDLQGCASVREEKPFGLPIDMFDCWFCFGHVDQSIRHCLETDFGWQKPIHASFDVCLHHPNSGFYHHSNELFQQGAKSISHAIVGHGESL